jgi:hypothetical protein
MKQLIYIGFGIIYLIPAIISLILEVIAKLASLLSHYADMFCKWYVSKVRNLYDRYDK